jgi:hypothetical protein
VKENVISSLIHLRKEMVIQIRQQIQVSNLNKNEYEQGI